MRRSATEDIYMYVSARSFCLRNTIHVYTRSYLLLLAALSYFVRNAIHVRARIHLFRNVL
jgi:uncharacterized membrane protein